MNNVGVETRKIYKSNVGLQVGVPAIEAVNTKKPRLKKMQSI